MIPQEYETCIDACVRCAQTCEHCAVACLNEPNIEKMAECIRIDQDCAKLCLLSVSFMSRGSQFAVDVCRLCAEVCEACGTECRKHEMDHCQACADACDICVEECRGMAGTQAR